MRPSWVVQRHQRQALTAAIDNAEQNFTFVRESRIAHNINYGLYLLNSSAGKVQAAMTEIDKSHKGPEIGGVTQKRKQLPDFLPRQDPVSGDSEV